MIGGNSRGASLESQGRPGRLAQLTSLRFFAAFVVLAHHFLGFAAGYAGVTFFYVLSGFILFHNYSGRVSTAAQRRDFWLRRAARIYPTHLLTFLLAIPLSLDLPPAKWAAVGMANLALIHALIPSWTAWFSFNAVSWTISSEAFFYGCFPALAIWMGSRPGLKASGVIGGVVVIATIWTIVTGATLDDTATRYLFYISPFLRISEFIAGMAIAAVMKTTSRPFGNFMEWAAILFAAVTLMFGRMVAPGAFAASLVFLPASILLVTVFAGGSGWLTKLLRMRTLVVLGEASFVLYMIHWLVRAYFVDLIGIWPSMIGSIAASVIIHYLFEQPARAWIGGLTGNWSSRDGKTHS